MTRNRLVALAAVGAILIGGIAYALVSRSSNDPVVPLFVDETASSGINHVYDGEFPYFVGGGVATFDCNDDGKPELYLAGEIGRAHV